MNSHVTGGAAGPYRFMMRTLLLLILGAVCAFPQFSVGVKAGVPMTDFFDTVRSPNLGFNSQTKRYIVGPMAELRLPGGFGVEFDALYRRINYEADVSLVDVFTNNRTTGNAWQFPLVAKYRFPFPVVRPYIEGGVAWNTFTGLKQSITNVVTGTRTTTSDPAELRDKTTTGLVLGAGVEVKAIFLRISPEVRYTRWGSEQFRDPTNALRWNRNQAEFLVGFTF
ncbi:MAG TPA: outer membrane beta-barrel protein [Bryobacteraceae bacterium]|nr:outer membrane beta-barrel protein [Bryobacteraceae bacterium]